MRPSAHESGFSMLEVIVAMALVGLGCAALLMALAQGQRDLRLTEAWASEENRGTQILMDELHRWERLRSDEARRTKLQTQGTDALLGVWEWRASLEAAPPSQAVGMYTVELHWRGPQGPREVRTHAALRILP